MDKLSEKSVVVDFRLLEHLCNPDAFEKFDKLALCQLLNNTNAFSFPTKRGHCKTEGFDFQF